MPEIENCTITGLYINNALRAYRIKANEGYLLHDRELDIVEIDPFTEEETSRIPGFTGGTCSCGYNYDWTANTREFYAVPADEVPENQIFGGADNNHEVM